MARRGNHAADTFTLSFKGVEKLGKALQSGMRSLNAKLQRSVYFSLKRDEDWLLMTMHDMVEWSEDVPSYLKVHAYHDRDRDVVGIRAWFDEAEFIALYPKEELEATVAKYHKKSKQYAEASHALDAINQAGNQVTSIFDEDEIGENSIYPHLVSSVNTSLRTAGREIFNANVFGGDDF